MFTGFARLQVQRTVIRESDVDEVTSAAATLAQKEHTFVEHLRHLMWDDL